MPTLTAFIDPESRAKAVLERARSANPEKAAELEALQGLAEMYAASVNTVRSVIVADVPAVVEADDPIAAQASRKR